LGEWEVEATDQFRDWFDKLDMTSADAVEAAVDRLAEDGPALGRPLVDRIRDSRYQHMKELRISGSAGAALRVLFAFDPRRVAILILGGNKTGEWNRWYLRSVPLADELYDEHLQELRREGYLP
jgi:hypothetical protein